MDHNKYVILNGQVLLKSEPVLYYNNRAFRYGDSVFETMHANGTELQFFEDHFERLLYAIKILKFELTDTFNPTLIYNQAKSLLVRNKLFKGAKVRLTLFRDEGGTYLPEKNSCSYLIETEILDSDIFHLNEKGLIVDIYEDERKQVNKLAAIKTGNSAFFILAGLYKQASHLDDVLLLNENNNIIEALNSNLFLVKGNQLFTPSIDEGCVKGIMRKKVIEMALDMKMIVFDDQIIRTEDLFNADEVILTNSINGIRWVLAFKNRRFFNKTAKLLTIKLNEMAFN